MTPIPEQIEGRMLPTVGRENYSEGIQMLLDLRNMPVRLTELPYREVRMGENQYLLGMDEKAFVLPADEIGSFIQTAETLELFPKYWSYFSLVRGFWEKAFNITIENEKYNSSSQLVRVVRKIKGERYAMEWIEEDVLNETPESTKMAITALAVLPDALWPKVVTEGLVVGNIERETADGRWKIGSDSLLFVPDMRKDFGNSKDSKGNAVRYFKSFRWPTIEDFVDQPRPNEGTDFVFIHPVGVFADTRDTPESRFALSTDSY
jgi:hypothetical protein